MTIVNCYNGLVILVIMPRHYKQLLYPVSKKQKEKAHMIVLTASKPTLYDFVLVERKLGKGSITMPFSLYFRKKMRGATTKIESGEARK